MEEQTISIIIGLYFIILSSILFYIRRRRIRCSCIQKFTKTCTSSILKQRSHSLKESFGEISIFGVLLCFIIGITFLVCGIALI